MTTLNQKLTQAIDALIGLTEIEDCSHCYGLMSIGSDPIEDCENCTFKEPELRHVFLALTKCKANWHMIENGCCVFEIQEDSPLMEFCTQEDIVRYDLTKTLYQQTDETKRWLLDLLSNKKEG